MKQNDVLFWRGNWTNDCLGTLPQWHYYVPLGMPNTKVKDLSVLGEIRIAKRNLYSGTKINDEMFSPGLFPKSQCGA